MEELLNEFLFFVAQRRAIGVGGMGGVAVGLVRGGNGTWYDTAAKAFRASTLRRSSALNHLSPRTRVVMSIMAGCCERYKVALLSASCAVCDGSNIIAKSSSSTS